jgi:hypothetical protein
MERVHEACPCVCQMHDPCKTAFDVTSRQPTLEAFFPAQIHRLLLLLLGGGPTMSSLGMKPPVAILLDRVEIMAQETTTRSPGMRVVEEMLPLEHGPRCLGWRHRPFCVRACACLLLPCSTSRRVWRSGSCSHGELGRQL